MSLSGMTAGPWSRRPVRSCWSKRSESGLDQAISAALASWRKPRAVHDPGKILVDLALAVALGGDCLADIAMLRSEPAVFGPVASDPTVSRLIDILAASGGDALIAIRNARSEVRRHGRKLADSRAPDADGQVTVDLDGVLVVAHSDKQDAAPTWKKTYGHHPLMGSSSTGRAGPANQSPLCSAPGTRARTQPPTTSRPPASPWPNCPRNTGGGGRPSSAATPRAAPTSSWPGSSSGADGCPTRSAW
jgi:hypothetical protein